MALRQLAGKLNASALRRASLVSPAVGSRHLAYRASQGQGRTHAFEDFEDFLKRVKYRGEEHRRVFKILEEDLDREEKLFMEEWDNFEKIMRKGMQDLARFRKKVDKIGDAATVVGLGASALAVAAFYCNQ